MSLDGCIADVDGGVDWLDGHGDDEDAVDSYAEFSKTIDTVLMGWNTYHQVVAELSPDEWVYQDFTRMFSRTASIFLRIGFASSTKIPRHCSIG